MLRIGAAALTVLLALDATSPALAANRSANFTARMTINAGCGVNAQDLVWAPTATLAGNEIANSTITVTCTPGTLWFLSFGIGTFTWSTTGTMAGVTPGNTDTINYSMQLQGFPIGFGNGTGQTTNLRGQITSSGSKNADNYIQARTIYVNF